MRRPVHVSENLERRASLYTGRNGQSSVVEPVELGSGEARPTWDPTRKYTRYGILTADTSGVAALSATWSWDRPYLDRLFAATAFPGLANLPGDVGSFSLPREVYVHSAFFTAQQPAANATIRWMIREGVNVGVAAPGESLVALGTYQEATDMVLAAGATIQYFAWVPAEPIPVYIEPSTDMVSKPTTAIPVPIGSETRLNRVILRIDFSTAVLTVGGGLRLIYRF